MHWKVKQKIPDDISSVYKDYSRLTSQLLYNRDIVTEKGIKQFLEPKYEDLHDPFLFKEMKIASDRIWQAIEGGEQITIYADYDADAVTAAAVLTRGLNYLGAKVNTYIPDRFTEGYGVNSEAIKQLKEQGTVLIITVDCGTNSVVEAQVSHDIKIDFIITDHHEITGEIPKAYALVNPKNPGDVYPENQITGVGVAFKVVQALFADAGRVEKRVSDHKIGWEKWLLDLVSIGTIADCHSLIGENRAFVYFGLKVIKKTKWPGLRELLNLLRDGEITSETVGFSLAPRINAAGRLAHASIALDCLVVDDHAEALRLATQVDGINKKRQDMTARLVSEAKEQAVLKLDSQKVLVLQNKDWHRGLVGIAAGKLSEEFNRPVFVLGGSETEFVGSGRGRGDFDMVACLKSASDALSKFGGHKQAAGLSVPFDKISQFESLVQVFASANSRSDESDSTEPHLYLESEVDEFDLAGPAAVELKYFEPFGIDNPKPLFLLDQAKLSNVKLVGKTKQHVQARFTLGSKLFDAIAFNSAKRFSNMNLYDTYRLAAEIFEDNFAGYPKLKLKIHSIQ